MKVAIAHDYLTQKGGAERVVLAMARAFPNAPIHTAIYDPAGTYPSFRSAEVRTSYLDVPPLRHDHRYAFPFLAGAWERTAIDADVAICSSSGWAHGATCSGRKLVYCHTPARWLYQAGRFVETQSGLGRVAHTLLRRRLERWDRRAAATADRYIANSTVVRDRIRDVYGIEADIVHPPHAADPDGPREPFPGLQPGYFLAVSRLTLYKNVQVLAEAFRGLPNERLVIVGHGPLRREIELRSRGNVTVVGTVTDQQLRWLYANCQAVVSAAYEDFGLTPVEGYAFGKPAVLLRWGGFLDSSVEGETAVFFDEAAPRAVRSAVTESRARTWSEERLRLQADAFSHRRFTANLEAAVAALT